MTSSQTADRPVPASRDTFRAFSTLPTRWMDVDIYGHVNNVQYLSFFDTAVNGWYVKQGLLDPRTSRSVFLVVETGCHYFQELVFPETITAGLRISILGSSSVVYSIGLFKEDGEATAALGRFVHVLVDRETRKPTPIEGRLRNKLTSLL
ncbi:thioesterase protein [Roseibium sp. TrichSKD4]|uniref:acyl-CoA thioesterase n=1 Tax=Roseibium sp. TrichSKD4 TaxID=744980 RepID=UPI0001E5769A|nr:thioesterase family protein [Roseibium sp. TrichSKD4]EFO29469.1 thioesterase protein [Roseibium sp. TrichSKD4]